MENSVIALETSATTAALDEAMAKAQGEIEAADKDKVNPAFRSKYADLTSVWNACRAPLSKHSIAVTQWPLTSADGRLHIITRLAHKGEWMQARFSLPIDKPNAHGVGSAITYAKRFTLSAALGIVADDDDDGNAAVASGGANKPPPAMPRQSSENGRRMAEDDPHLVDANRPKGTTAPKAGDALNLSPHSKTDSRDPVTLAKKWVDDASKTVNLSGQTKDSLASFWKDSKKQLDYMEANVPEEYERFLLIYDKAIEVAAVKGA